MPIELPSTSPPSSYSPLPPPPNSLSQFYQCAVCLHVALKGCGWVGLQGRLRHKAPSSPHHSTAIDRYVVLSYPLAVMCISTFLGFLYQRNIIVSYLSCVAICVVFRDQKRNFKGHTPWPVSLTCKPYSACTYKYIYSISNLQQPSI